MAGSPIQASDQSITPVTASPTTLTCAGPRSRWTQHGWSGSTDVRSSRSVPGRCSSMGSRGRTSRRNSSHVLAFSAYDASASGTPSATAAAESTLCNADRNPPIAAACRGLVPSHGSPTISR